MEFRARDYRAEEAAASLPRSPAPSHPLSPSPSTPSQVVDAVTGHQEIDFYDPLGVHGLELAEPVADAGHSPASLEGLPSETSHLLGDGWPAFRRSVLQKFSSCGSGTISISKASDILAGRKNVPEKSSKEEELEESSEVVKDAIEVVSRHEYVSRIHEVRDEITQAWRENDRVTALKLSVKVTRLLMDTSSPQFYPASFILITDVLNMLGELVLERIKSKAKCLDNEDQFCLSTENFVPSDICTGAKEICNNWFRKIGSIRELLPRIYLELSILHCRCFLEDQPLSNVQRLMLMLRGIADPIAFVYCHLYLVQRLHSLYQNITEYLVASMRDISVLLTRIIDEKPVVYNFPKDKRRLLTSVLEPAIERIMKCIFKGNDLENALLQFGITSNFVPGESIRYSSIILHYLLKELPVEIICGNALKVLKTFELCSDTYIDEHINYRLLGLKLNERLLRKDMANSILSVIFERASKYSEFNKYLIVIDAYMDIIIQLKLDNYILVALGGISDRALKGDISEDDMSILQSILVKLINNSKDLDIFSLNHFMELVDLLYGDSRDTINVCLLYLISRRTSICDPRIIQLLFEVCQSVHGKIDPLDWTHDALQRTNLISHFVQMVDFRMERECHLMFLVECRAAFGNSIALKKMLVHKSNFLSMKALQDGKKNLAFIKACIAFNEVTIPSIADNFIRVDLYLETAEVSLLSGLVFHAQGLINMTINSCEDAEFNYGSQTAGSQMISSLGKLCSLLVMFPGHPAEGISRKLMSSDSQPWMTSNLEIKMWCAIILSSASLSQVKLPYIVNNNEVVGNNALFIGDASYKDELLSISTDAVKKMVDTIENMPHTTEQGRLALDACNCFVMSFKMSHDVSAICAKLIEIAKSSLHPSERYLLSTLNIFNQLVPMVS